jgi:hypothetical protein
VHGKQIVFQVSTPPKNQAVPPPLALHYDWSYSLLLHFLRTGHRSLFDTAAAMAKHRYDIDQYHGDRTDTKGNHKYINNEAFYESSGHADPTLACHGRRACHLTRHL